MGGGRLERGLLGAARDLAAVDAEGLLADLLTQDEDRVDEGLGAGRAAGQVDVDGDDVVAALDDGVVVEDAAGGRARTHGDDPLRFGHRVVDAADDGRHLVRDTARYDHHVGVTRRGTEDLEAEARHVETGGAGGHHLDGAARQTHGDGPLAVLACEPEDFFDAGERDTRGQGFFKSHLSFPYLYLSSPGRRVAIRRRRGRRG